MRIGNLTGHKACRYDDLNITFQDGTILINGKNKSGKSSVLDILTFAIYGSCQKSKKLSYFRKRGTTPPTKTRIRFEFMGKEWLIDREISGKGQTAKLYVGDMVNPAASGASDVESYLKEYFVPEDLLLNSNLASQRDMSKLLHTTDGVRFKMFKKIFNLERYQALVTKVKNDIEEKTGDIATFNTQVELVEKRVQESVEFLKGTDLSELQGLVAAKEKEVSDSEKEISDTDTKIGAVRQKVETIEAQNSLIRSENQKILDLKSETKGIEEDIKAEQLAEVKGQEGLKKATELFAGADTAKKEAETDAAEIKVERVMAFDSTQLDEALTKLGTTIGERTSAKDRLILAQKGVCPTCNKPTDDLKTDEIEAQISALSETITDITATIETLRAEKESAETRQAEMDERRSNRKLLFQEAEAQDKLCDSYKERITTASRTITETNGRILKLQESLEAKSKTLGGLKEKPLIVDDQIESELSGLITSRDSLTESLNGLKSELSDYNTAVRSYRELQESVKTDNKQVESLKDDLLSMDKELADLKDCREIFEKKLPLFMVMHKLKIIEKEANKFLHKVDDQFTISFEATSKDALSIMIWDDIDKEESPSENLSGFEETLIGLSIRVGISHYNNYINNQSINWFAVDEPDKSADDSNTDLMFRSLKELGKEFSQLIVITHKEFIKESLYGAQVLDVVRESKQNSIVVEAS